MKRFFKYLSLLLCICVMLFSATGCELLEDLFGEDDYSGDDYAGNTNNYSSDYNIETIKSSNLSIHIVAGKYHAQDCIYIKAGDNDILIDSGYETDTTYIQEYINQFVTDNKFEYTICTHSDQDHISGFFGKTNYPGLYEVYNHEYIIDFGDLETVYTEGDHEGDILGINNKKQESYIKYVNGISASNDLASYKSAREKAINNGAEYHAAFEYFEENTDLSTTFDLGNGIKMYLLYNYYYDHYTGNNNNYSVCVLINDGTNNYLLTGDLENEDGSAESKLIENNNLPKCAFYKAGHHGSKTSSSLELLEKINPDIVAVSCTAGTKEYPVKSEANQFPTQTALDNISQYTDSVYVTCQTGDISARNSDAGYNELNGTIVVYSSNNVVSVACTNGNTKLKDSDWLKNELAVEGTARYMPTGWAN